MTLRPVLAIAALSALGFACGPGGPDHEALRTGRGVYADTCSACHGNRGQGGVGPSLSAVRTVWPSCADHMEWIKLGSQRWQDERGPTYGALERQIDQVMPGFEDNLTDAQIAAVAAFERVEYGGGDPEAEIAACGASS